MSKRTKNRWKGDSYEIFAKIKDSINKFRSTGLSPNEIAMGISLGILKAFAPVLGTQIIMSIFLTHIFRFNTLVVLFGTSISNSHFSVGYLCGDRKSDTKRKIIL